MNSRQKVTRQRNNIIRFVSTVNDKIKTITKQNGKYNDNYNKKHNFKRDIDNEVIPIKCSF